MRIIDLRSDTMSHPTPEMWRAMAEAEVGDDVYREDPTVNRLEGMVAELLEKEAALFVSSGTMANLVSVLAHSQPGRDVIAGEESHVFQREKAMIEAVGSVSLRPVASDDRGVITPNDAAQAIEASNGDQRSASVVCVENTHNHSGGHVVDTEDIAAVAQVAHAGGAAVYLDGARLFNAAVALGVSAAEVSAPADTVAFCLSKGLGCPAGSMVCGSAETIDTARKYKVLLGGGMRQIGMLAAAGIVGMNTMVERLAEDHAHAKRLAAGLSAIPGLVFDPDAVETNIVLFEVVSCPAEQLIAALKERGVLINHQGGQQVRMLTHPGICSDDVEEALKMVAVVAEEVVVSRS